MFLSAENPRSCYNFLLVFTISLLLVVLVGSLHPATAHASEVTLRAAATQGATLANANGSYSVVYHAGKSKNLICINCEGTGSDPIAPKAESSNPEVIKVLKRKGSCNIDLQALKTGKSTITYEYKGESHKVEITVYKYANPVKSFKVGKTQLAKNYSKWLRLGSAPIVIDECIQFCHWQQNLAELSGKVSVTPAKGWKLKYIRVSNKHYKNGSNLKKGNRFMEAVLVNPKKNLLHALQVRNYNVFAI